VTVTMSATGARACLVFVGREGVSEQVAMEEIRRVLLAALLVQIRQETAHRASERVSTRAAVIRDEQACAHPLSLKSCLIALSLGNFGSGSGFFECSSTSLTDCLKRVSSLDDCTSEHE